MNWQQKGAYYLESDCGRYSVAKSFVNGAPRYTAWLRGRFEEKPVAAEALGYFDTADEAKACAEHHAQQVVA